MNVLKKPNSDKIIRFLVWFYTIGIIGFLWPLTHSIFIWLTPFSIIFTFFLILIYHQPAITSKNILLWGFIYVLGLSVEIAGVNTGFIFGTYYYGDGLGIKVFSTPLIIGVNWIMLTYCSHIISQSLPVKSYLKVWLGALLMLLYDLVLEQVASYFNMWHWEGNKIPLRNYIAWFLIALVMQYIMSKSSYKNKIGSLVFLLQFAFFFIIMVAIKIIGI